MSINTKSINIKWEIFFVSATGGFLAMLDTNTVNVALYEIAKDFNVSITQVQWVVTSYILVLSTFLTLFGKLNDIIDRRHLYAGGYIVFGLGSLFNFFAPNIITLIVCRMLQALGASILLSNNYAIISSVFKGKKRAKALGFSSALMALSGMTGPALGGFLMHYFGWRSIFIPGIIMALCGAYFSEALIPSVKHHKQFKFDYMGMLFLLIATFSLLLIVSQGHSWGWFSKKIILIFFIFVIFSMLFYREEKRVKYPVIDFKLFKSKVFLFGNFALLLSYFALFANAMLFPFYAQEILKATPLVTGLLIIPFSLSFVTAACFGGRLVNKFGSGALMVTGSVFIIIGLLLFSLCSSESNYTKIILAQMIAGLGSGLYQPSVNIIIMNSAMTSEMGIASGILALFRNSGMLLGIMISISVFDFIKINALKSAMTYTDAFLSAYHGALLFGAGFAFICMIFSFLTYKAKKYT